MHDGEIIEEGKINDIKNKYKMHENLILKFKNKVDNLDVILSNFKYEKLKFQEIKMNDYFQVTINAPEKGWTVDQKMSIINSLIDNKSTPNEFFSSKVKLIDILSAVTGLDAIKIGMNLQRKNRRSEEE